MFDFGFSKGEKIAQCDLNQNDVTKIEADAIVKYTKYLLDNGEGIYRLRMCLQAHNGSQSNYPAWASTTPTIR